MNPKFRVCGKHSSASEVFLLIYVHSAPENFKRRLSLRETWLRRSMFKNVRVVFMMGYVNNKNIHDKLKLENTI